MAQLGSDPEGLTGDELLIYRQHEQDKGLFATLRTSPPCQPQRAALSGSL